MKQHLVIHWNSSQYFLSNELVSRTKQQIRFFKRVRFRSNSKLNRGIKNCISAQNVITAQRINESKMKNMEQ